MTDTTRPNDIALAHSDKLVQRIKEEILQAGGTISFARFMELALYAPGLGYYSAGSYKLGRGGDFITAPEISPLFAQCLAKQCHAILTTLGTGNILEFGAGSGKLAADLLCELERLNCLPQQYFILEISADLRDRQQKQLTQQCPHLLPRVTWLETLPATGISGIVLANEVLDAMPVHCFHQVKNHLLERCVAVSDEKFHWQDTPATPELTQRVAAISDLEDGYQSEINLRLPSWMQSLASSLKAGVILLFDYGYGRREYYHPDRDRGTLMCFYQHSKNNDPFARIGLQDITAHVDFTAVAESALDANLQLAGYTTQGSFLLACGLLTRAEQNALSATEQYQQNQAIKLLTLPSQMGELVKAIALSKNFSEPLLGFSLHDRRRDL